MKYYAGLDVSLKKISICVVDADGKTVARGVSPAVPEGVAGWFRAKSLSLRLIVHESGQLSIWLQRGLERLGLPAICIDARKAHKRLCQVVLACREQGAVTRSYLHISSIVVPQAERISPGVAV